MAALKAEATVGRLKTLPQALLKRLCGLRYMT